MKQTTTTIPARLRTLLRIGLIAGLALLGARPAVLAKSRVPANIQAAIFVHVLESDGALNPRSDQTTIGLLFKADELDSMQQNMAIIQAFSAFERRALRGRGLRLAYRAYRDEADLSDWASREQVDVLYVAEGLDDHLTKIRDWCLENKVIPVTPVPDFVERGLAIGVVIHKNKARLMVNLPATESLGMRLAPEVLKLAKVVR